MLEGLTSCHCWKFYWRKCAKFSCLLNIFSPVNTNWNESSSTRSETPTHACNTPWPASRDPTALIFWKMKVGHQGTVVLKHQITRSSYTFAFSKSNLDTILVNPLWLESRPAGMPFSVVHCHEVVLERNIFKYDSPIISPVIFPSWKRDELILVFPNSNVSSYLPVA